MRMKKFVFVASLFTVLLFSPALMSGTTKKTPLNYTRAAVNVKELLATKSAVIYDSLRLGEFGLNEKAFQYAWKGYQNLLEKGKTGKSRNYFNMRFQSVI